MIIIRRKENQFYILYERIRGKEKWVNKYVIYRTNNFGGDLFKEFKTYRETLKVFNKATAQALEQYNIMQYECA